MDITFRIQGIKSQIENMNLQIDNIQSQNNIMNMNMMSNQIGEQLLNLSFQLLNTGIQAFNAGKNMITIMDTNKFYERLKNISEQINLIINYNDMNQMQQQQMMMQQQMMIQQQMNEKQPIINGLSDKRPSKNIIFVHEGRIKNTINIKAKYGTKVEEVLNEYINRIAVNDEKLVFVFNANKINRKEQRVIEDFFRLYNNPTIQVFQY